MAHGYLDKFSDSSIKIYSAGVATHGLNPKAVKYMNQDGVDISHHTSNLIDEYMDIKFDLILTVCDHANETCPYFPSTAKKIHRNFEDPSKYRGTENEIELKFIEIRNQIKEYCQELIKNV